jgi:peptide/nickel transport system permease protein
MIHWRRFFAQKQNILGLIIVGFIIFVAAAAPRLSPPLDPENPGPYKELHSTFFQMPKPPSQDSPLGTVPKPPRALPGVPIGQGPAYQWDVYHTLVWGTRSALRFGLTVTVLTAVFGIMIGVISGYAGGIINSLTMRVTDAFLAFPPIAAIWVLDRAIFSHLTDPFGLPIELNAAQELLLKLDIDAVMVALILFSWMPYARLVNAMALQVKQAEFIEAARSLGATDWRIIWRHLLPNAISPAIVLAARDVGGMVILASAFTFIGMGGDIAWGFVLVGGRDYILGLGGNPFAYWWVFLPISLALILFSIGWNLLGDGLNDLLNPRSVR